jgi:uncharacterized membrane protein
LRFVEGIGSSIESIMSSISSIASIFSHSTSRWAAGGWTFFIAENALLSENRTWIIAELGDENYHLAYGTLSTMATGSILYAYYKMGKMDLPPQLKTRPRTGTPAAVVGWMFLSVGLVMASQAAPKMQIPVALVDSKPEPSAVGPSQKPSSTRLQVRCPFDFADKRADPSSSQIHGTERISRHPGLWSFGLVGLGQSVLAPTIPKCIWWLGPAAVAWLGGWHTDSRFRRGIGGTLSPEYQSQTSNIPFWAMASGKQGSGSWQALAEDIKPWNACLALGVSTLWVLRRVR